MLQLKIKIWRFTVPVEVEDQPLADLIGNVVMDVMDRREVVESKRAIGFYISHKPEEPFENGRRI